MIAVALAALLACASPAAEPVTALAGWAPGPLRATDATRARILREADIALGRPSRVVASLASAGSADPDDAQLEASRAAFQDADDTLLLALVWRLTDSPRYRDAARARLLGWARTYVPTGHPIDETRLDAVVRAAVLLDGTLAPEDRATVRRWLAAMRDAKRAWRWGPVTADNNHRTHQLAMLLLLDRALGDTDGFALDTREAEAHAARNLDAGTGESVDLRARKALYYHAYDLDAWLEIVLLTDCCEAPVSAAWRLLEHRLQEGHVDGEFEGSTSPLDAARGRAGFGYGTPGSTFDPRRAQRAVLAWHTTPAGRDRAPALLPVPIERRNLYALARYESWRR